MGFWNKLFGSKQKKRPQVPRNSKAVARLARRRGISIESLDLEADWVLEELLELGLMLRDDEFGSYYTDDPEWVESGTGDSVSDTVPHADTLTYEDRVTEAAEDTTRSSSYTDEVSYDIGSSYSGSSSSNYDSGSSYSGGSSYDSGSSYSGGGSDFGGGDCGGDD